MVAAVSFSPPPAVPPASLPPETSPQRGIFIQRQSRECRRDACVTIAEAAGFFLRQALEKLHKAFLLSRGWQLRRIHNLDTLLDDAVTHDPSLEKFRGACQKIAAFYFLERYPFVVDAARTREDVQTWLEQVRDLIQKLRNGSL